MIDDIAAEAEKKAHNFSEDEQEYIRKYGKVGSDTTLPKNTQCIISIKT